MATTTSSAKALAAQLRDLLDLKGPRSRCHSGNASAFTVLKIRIHDAEIPEPVRQALYGLDWSRRSGRVDIWVEQYMQGLSDWQWCNFIADIASTPGCARGISGEVPSYLAQRFPRP
jgi:hypothetical protein